MTTTADIVRIDYTNHRGERRVRLVVPDRLWFGRVEWHDEEQWLLDGLDIVKGERRTFAMVQVHAWEAA